jgi:hypothetical protein
VAGARRNGHGKGARLGGARKGVASGRTAAARRAGGRHERPHETSGTAVAAEALRTGLLPVRLRLTDPAGHDGELLRVGDPDDDALANEYVGEDTPGGSTPTPDQGNVDAIGRAYGLQEEDTGALRSGAEVLARRDRHRAELVAPRRRP